MSRVPVRVDRSALLEEWSSAYAAQARMLITMMLTTTSSLAAQDEEKYLHLVREAVLGVLDLLQRLLHALLCFEDTHACGT